MDRHDLERSRSALPDITDRWEHKIAQLEKDRERAWNDLRHLPLFGPPEEVDQQAEDTYRRLHRLDRSIAFLDRALLHLSDLERGTHYADDLPLRP